MSDSVHFVIPDTQIKPGVPMDHLSWVGQYLVDEFAGHPNLKVIHLGDHWDFPSLSSYDKGKKSMEGRRYLEDLQAGNLGFRILNEALDNENARLSRNKKAQWNPRKIILMGNHEDRADRAASNDAQLDGLIGSDSCDTLDWERVPFLQPIFIDGVGYSHYWPNPMTGKPLGGQMPLRLKTLGHSFTMGHVQTLDYAMRYVRDHTGNPMSQHGLVAGACYLHKEDYKGPNDDMHWRGIVVKREVRRGMYEPQFITLNYLKKRYDS